MKRLNIIITVGDNSYESETIIVTQEEGKKILEDSRTILEAEGERLELDDADYVFYKIQMLVWREIDASDYLETTMFSKRMWPRIFIRCKDISKIEFWVEDVETPRIYSD